jgi:transcriptional regulator with XRE-family HTH domain
MVNPELPALLREMVTRSGLSYRDLGTRVGLNPAILSLLVQGKRYPTRDTIIALALECGYGRGELNRLLRSAGFAGLMAEGPASLAAAGGTGSRERQLSRPARRPTIRAA